MGAPRRGGIDPSSGGCSVSDARGVAQKQLDDEDVAPGAIEPAVAMVNADALKATALDQADACDVIYDQLADHLWKPLSRARAASVLVSSVPMPRPRAGPATYTLHSPMPA